MFFFKKYKNGMIVAIVAIILIIIIGVTSSGRIEPSKTEKAIGKVITPIEKFFYKIGRAHV